MPFTHEPIPPRVPAEAQHSNQRWFKGTGFSVRPPGDFYSSAEVYRDGRKDSAEVRLTMRGGGPVYFDAALELNAGALRELAQRLLDAAHDLEVFPATAESAS